MTHEYSKQHQKYYALNPISHRRKSIKSDTADYHQTTQSTHESHISKHDMRKNSFSRLERYFYKQVGEEKACIHQQTCNHRNKDLENTETLDTSTITEVMIEFGKEDVIKNHLHNNSLMKSGITERQSKQAEQEKLENQFANKNQQCQETEIRAVCDSNIVAQKREIQGFF